MKDPVKGIQLESLMTPRQVAQFLQVSVCTVGRWSRQGRLAFFRVGRRGDMRYRLEDVLRFIEDSTAQPREHKATVGNRGL